MTESCGDITNFDDVSDKIVANIASWLLAMPSNKTPNMQRVRDVIRFSVTCKKMFRIINRSECDAFDIWSTIDVAVLIREKVFFPAEKQRAMAAQMITIPQIRFFQRLSWCPSLTAAHILGLIISMPKLRVLEIQPRDPEPRDDSLRSVIPKKFLHKGMINSRRIFTSIGSLKNLRSLTLIGRENKDLDLSFEFPSTLCDLCIHNTDLSRIKKKCSDARFESIRSLKFIGCTGNLIHAIVSFSAITSLSIFGGNLIRAETQKIWETCTLLEEIDIGGDRCCFSLESFEKSPCSKNLRKLKLNISVSDERFWEVVSRSCSNLKELRIVRPALTSSDIRALKSLKNLHVLEIIDRYVSNFDGHSEAFGELGESDGVPFTVLSLSDIDCDLQRLFSSRRCRQLREIEVNHCLFSEQCITAISRESIKSFKLDGRDMHAFF